MRTALLGLAIVWISACGGDDDGAGMPDGGRADSGTIDGGGDDGGGVDGGGVDAGEPDDAGPSEDGGEPVDAGEADASPSEDGGMCEVGALCNDTQPCPGEQRCYGFGGDGFCAHFAPECGGFVMTECDPGRTCLRGGGGSLGYCATAAEVQCICDGADVHGYAVDGCSAR